MFLSTSRNDLKLKTKGWINIFRSLRMTCSVTIDLNLFVDALGCVDSADEKDFFRFLRHSALHIILLSTSLAKRVLTKGSWRLRFP